MIRPKALFNQEAQDVFVKSINDRVLAIAKQVLKYKRMGWSDHQVEAVIVGEFGYIEKASDPNVGASSNTKEKEQVG